VAVKVLLPGLLATQAGGKNSFEVDVPTVGAALRALPISDLLFDEAGDPIEVIKWKSLYDLMERAFDKCEDVANVLENVVLKNG